ncbi:hypothetical protein GCM10010103_52870 [Streptomyces paradoxus]
MSASSLPEVSSTQGWADAPGSGLIRIDGYAAADREYSPPCRQQYPKYQEQVKQLAKGRPKPLIRELYVYLVRAVATWESTCWRTWLPGGTSDGSYVQA